MESEGKSVAQQQAYLNDRINHALLPTLRATFNGSITLQVAQERITFEIRHAELSWLPATAPSDATFYFASWRDLRDLLCGTGDIMQAFMDHRVWADGYLIWTFTLLGLFRGQPTQN